MLLELKYFAPLMRSSEEEIYLGVIALDELVKAEIKVLHSETIVTQWITIIYGSIAQDSPFVIKIISAQLVSALPHGSSDDEYPVIFISSTKYLPTAVESALLSKNEFASLIERKQNLSKNSTKVMTQQSLREILQRVFRITLAVEEMTYFQQELLKYVDELQSKYSFLSYLPLKERQSIRERYVSDLSFAWEMYFRYFVDKWNENKTVPLPDLSRNYQINGWEGDFFDRENPFWKSMMSDRQKFKFNQIQRENLYLFWIDWLNK